MSEQNKFEAFLQEVLQREMPENRIARVRTLAKELAEGALAGFWNVRDMTSDGNCSIYLRDRWQDHYYPYLSLLEPNGYMQHNQLEKAAFDLVQEAELADVFISYRRKDSSAFAMFVLTRLKMAGLNAYLDMAILAGDDWQERVKEEIEKREYFVVLLGQETLSSPIVCQEILWALESERKMIPIWHNGYRHVKGEFDLDLEIDEALDSRSAIRVLEESGLGYNNAIVELLNRFGITP